MAVLDWLQQLLGGGQAGEETAAAGRLAAMQPGANVLGQNLLGAGQAVGGDIGDMLDSLWQSVVKAPGDALRGGQPLPPEMSATGGVPSPVDQTLPVAMAMVGGGWRPAGSLGSGGFPIRAYHGSPYDFERFDLSKIGTGEGAQAYGHGLYFAESPKTAEAYRSGLAPGPTEIIAPGGDVVSQRGAIGSTQALADAISPHVKGDDYIRRAIARAWLDKPDAPLNPEDVSWNAFGSMAARDSPEAQALVSKMLAQAQPVLDKFKMRRPGHTYEVDINAAPQRLLDWDKPLSEQPQQLRSLFGPGDMRQDIGRTMYGDLARHYGGQEAASQKLQDAGIPGIKYLDQGSRGAGQGTSNYVMFDPALIQILRKYGIVGPAAGAGLLGAAEQ